MAPPKAKKQTISPVYVDPNIEASYSDSIDKDEERDNEAHASRSDSDVEGDREASPEVRNTRELDKPKKSLATTSKSSASPLLKKKYFLPASLPDIDYQAIFTSPIRRNIELLEGVTIALGGKRVISCDEDEPLHIIVSSPSEECLKKARSRIEPILYQPDVARALYVEINPNASAATTLPATQPKVTVSSVAPTAPAPTPTPALVPTPSVAPPQSIPGVQPVIPIVRPYANMPSFLPTSSADVTTEGHVVPDQMVGLIIGKGGLTLKAILQRTGTTVSFDKAAQPETPNDRRMELTGTSSGIAEAKREIQDIVEGRQVTPRGPNVGYMHVPDEKVGLIIGKNGATITEVQRMSGASVQIPIEKEPGSNPPYRKLAVSGTYEQQEKARIEINRIIGAYGPAAANMPYTPPALANYLQMAAMNLQQQQQTPGHAGGFGHQQNMTQANMWQNMMNQNMMNQNMMNQNMMNQNLMNQNMMNPNMMNQSMAGQGQGVGSGSNIQGGHMGSAMSAQTPSSMFDQSNFFNQSQMPSGSQSNPSAGASMGSGSQSMGQGSTDHSQEDLMRKWQEYYASVGYSPYGNKASNY